MAKAIVVTTPIAQPPIRLKIPFMFVWLEGNRACGQGEVKMRGLKLGLGSVVAAGLLAACLEAQPAPDVPQRTSSEFGVIEIVSGLDKPWSVAELPDGGYLITEIGGRLLRFSDTSKRIELSGLPADIAVGGQGGLLDVVLAPDFESSSELYISYAYGTANANGTALIKATLNGEALVNTDVIFRANPPKAASSHFGGKIAVLPDDTLVLTLGDGFAYREDSQKPETHLGKLVRLNRDDTVPADNPYIGQEKNGGAFKPEIFSIGHRNPQGLAYDAQTNTLWAHEHGPRGGDELNRIAPGANYGWPIATTGRDYQGARISPFETYAGMVDPVYDWVPSIAPSGLAIYRGDMFPNWNGDALIGGLASRDLRRVDLENGAAVGEESLLADLDGRIRDVRVARDGSVLVLIEDSENGKLIKLRPK